jgi:hypothetical protein
MQRQNSLEAMLENAFASPTPKKSTPKKSPLKRQNSIDDLVKMLTAPSGRKIAPRSRPAKKIAPRSRPAKKIAPGVAKIALPDRQFAHKFDGMNTGKKDTQGRIIYAGPQGGKFVISSIGSRVPFMDEKLDNKMKAEKNTFTGQVDRDGLAIFRGKQGGLFVIKPSSGKRGNPLRPFSLGKYK